MGAALWWAAKSPAGPVGLGLAALPWALSAALILPTGGLSMMLCVALYAPLALWSARRAGEHFRGQKPGSDAGAFLAPGLAWAFCACSLSALAWTHFWTSGTGLGAMLAEVAKASDAASAKEAASRYWGMPGMSGVKLPLALQQLGLAIANAWWCLLPFAAADRPQASASELAKAGLRMMRKAPLALFLLGALGALWAQASLRLAPLALLSGLWFCACAFAWRDLRSTAWEDSKAPSA